MNIFSNVGITELIVILLLALLVVGPERLPELARQLAKILRDARTAYENLTKDLGPELMSIEKTTREIRESVNSVRSIPKDMVGSVVRAAELEKTVEGLKGVQKSIEETGQSVVQAGEMIRKPLDETLETARDALAPKKTAAQTEPQSSELEIDVAEEGEPSTRSTGGTDEDQTGSSAAAALRQESDPGGSTLQAIEGEKADDTPSPEVAGHEQTSS